jgi:ubiquinone/menaquinone biosynthesis C-methylase UbiE
MSARHAISRTESWKANIEYHEKFLDSYDKLPHFNKESIERVKSILHKLASRSKNGQLVDIGCGTGFMLHIARPFFRKIHGVDICRQALKRAYVNGTSLWQCSSEHLCFGDNSVDAVTGFSVLHHLYDIEPTLREAYRILKAGGFVYFDDEPNGEYFAMIHKLSIQKDLPEIQANEVESIINVEQLLFERDGIEPELVRMAEFQKLDSGGFKKESIVAQFEKIGFVEVNLQFRWFLGQRALQQSGKRNSIRIIENYLLSMLPVTEPLFKYFWVTARKEESN